MELTSNKNGRTSPISMNNVEILTNDNNDNVSDVIFINSPQQQHRKTIDSTNRNDKNGTITLTNSSNELASSSFTIASSSQHNAIYNSLAGSSFSCKVIDVHHQVKNQQYQSNNNKLSNNLHEPEFKKTKMNNNNNNHNLITKSESSLKILNDLREQLNIFYGIKSEINDFDSMKMNKLKVCVIMCL